MDNTFDFDFKAGDFRMRNGNPITLTGVDALKLWIEKCIRTQLNRYHIYNGYRYGANLEDLVIGKNYGADFTESELKREVEEALLQHDDILSLNDFNVTREKRSVRLAFTLVTTYGDVKEAYVYGI